MENLPQIALRPHNRRLLVLQDAPREETENGIFIPNVAQKSPSKWTVLAVSSDLADTFKRGDRLYVPGFAGVRPTLDETDIPSEFAERIKIITADEVQGFLT